MGSHIKFDLSEGQARDILERHSLGQFKTLKRFEKGIVNDVFDVNGRYVIKVNTSEPKSNKIDKEAFVYRLLLRQGVPAPDVVAVDNSLSILDYPYSIVTRIKGEPLSLYFGSMPMDKQRTVLMNLGSLLAKAHSVHFDRFGDEFDGKTIGTFERWSNYVADKLRIAYDRIEKSKVISPAKLKEIRELMNRNMHLFEIDVSPSLVHSNYGFDNILTDKEGRIKGIVDCEYSASRHHEYEVAYFVYRVLKMDKPLMDAFLTGYKQFGKISSEFETRVFLYSLMHCLIILPFVPTYTHAPEKQREYLDGTDKLVRIIQSKGV